MSQPKIKYLSSIREVAKDESSFYCVMEPMEENLENVILGDLSKEDIYKISRNLIQMICHFHEHKVIPR